MSSIYRLGQRSGKRRGCFYTNVPRELGTSVQRSTGTKDCKLARQIGEMVDRLGPRGIRRWDVLGAVVDGRASLGEVWDAYARNDLDGLLTRLNDLDLSSLVDEFARYHGTRVTPAHATLVKGYLRQLFVSGVRFPGSSLTSDRIAGFLDELSISTGDKRALASGTRLKYYAALSAYCGWLTKKRHITANPMREVDKPKVGDPRNRHLSHENAVRLVSAVPLRLRAVEALAHCGAEVSAIIRLTRGDVDLGERTFHAKGTKSAWRDRIVPVQEWALPFVKAACRRKLPNAPLFPGLDRHQVHKLHDEACKALGSEFSGYRFHDARRTFAITALKNGATHEAVAYVLGHKDARLVITTYGRYAPNLEALRACDPSEKPSGDRASAKSKGG